MNLDRCIRTTLPCLLLGPFVMAVAASSSLALTSAAANKASDEQLRFYIEGVIDMAAVQANAKGQTKKSDCIAKNFYGADGGKLIDTLVKTLKSPLGADKSPAWKVAYTLDRKCGA